MSTAWVAATVRAKSLTRRRVGRAAARSIAASSLDDAVAALARSPYAHDLPASSDPEALQHAVGATLLWHLRVLAGWLPHEGAEDLRALAAGFEISNLDEHLAALRGRPATAAYDLGSLATAWARLRDTSSLSEVRQVLTSSRWGDPGDATAWSIGLAVRLSWAERVVTRVPEAADWARTGAALLLARVISAEGRLWDEPLRRQAQAVLGPGPAGAAGSSTPLAELARLLPPSCRWALVGVDDPADLWRAEARLAADVERDGFRLLHRPGFGRATVVGAAAVLAVDAWRLRAALGSAARGGSAVEVFDAVA
jgi:hypothetical protein